MAATTYSQSITMGATAAGLSYTSENVYTGDAQDQRSIDVAADATDFEVDFVLDVSAISSIWIESDVNLELFTNTASPGHDENISLLAGVPYIWSSDSYFVNLLATDITALFFNEVNSVDAVVTITVVYDSTSPA